MKLGMDTPWDPGSDIGVGKVALNLCCFAFLCVSEQLESIETHSTHIATGDCSSLSFSVDTCKQLLKLGRVLKLAGFIVWFLDKVNDGPIHMFSSEGVNSKLTEKQTEVLG